MAKKPIGFLPFKDDEDDEANLSQEQYVLLEANFINAFAPADNIQSATQLMSLQEIADLSGIKASPFLAAQLLQSGYNYYQASTSKMYFVRRK